MWVCRIDSSAKHLLPRASDLIGELVTHASSCDIKMKSPPGISHRNQCSPEAMTYGLVYAKIYPQQLFIIWELHETCCNLLIIVSDMRQNLWKYLIIDVSVNTQCGGRPIKHSWDVLECKCSILERSNLPKWNKKTCNYSLTYSLSQCPVRKLICNSKYTWKISYYTQILFFTNIAG